MIPQKHTRRIYHWSVISKDESTLLRAFAILAIVFHNYLHWVSDSPGENEFTYRPERIDALIQALWSTPLDSIRLLATYFGHYGVQVFFFLSGYGITIKYLNAPPSTRWLSFQKARWSALYPAIFIAAIGYFLYDGIRLGWHHVLTEEGVNILRQMGGVSNFIPDNVYHPIGPWWFIGVILQFYLLAPLILQGVRRYGDIRRYGDRFLFGIIASSLLLELALGPVLSRQFDFNINHSILGHLDVCALGIWFARRKTVNLPTPLIAGAAVLFVIGNFQASLWITTGITSLLVAIPVLRLLTPSIERHPWPRHALMFIGQLSMYLFLCNGYLRRPLIESAQQSPHWWTSIWTSLLFLGIVIVWSVLLRKAEQGVRHLTRKIPSRD